jgi:hypothetical protein
MVNLRRLADQAKKIVDRRGGTDALKEDATELKDIATGEGSMKDKAKAAADAVKDPGAPGEEQKKQPGAPGAEEKRPAE